MRFISYRIPGDKTFGPLKGMFLFFLFFGFITHINAQISVSINTSGPNPVPTGQEICFNVAYTWSSTTADLYGAKIKIPLPASLAGDNVGDVPVFNSPHIASSSYDPGTRMITWNMIDPLPAGSSGTVSFCAHFPNGTTSNGTPANLVPTFSGNGQIPASGNLTLTADASSKATVNKYLNVDPALDYDAVYTILLYNDQGYGNYNLTNVVVTDPLPAGAMFVSASNGGTESGGTVTWNIASLPINTYLYLKLKVKYPSGAYNLGDMVTNTVYMTGTSPAGQTPTVSSSKTNTISAPNPICDIAKWSWTDWMSLGGGTGYTIYHNNTGNVPLTNIVLQEDLPVEFNVTGGYLPVDYNNTTNHATFEYQTRNDPGVWHTWPGSPFTLTYPNGFYYNASDIGINPYLVTPTDYITKLRLTFDELSVGYEGNGFQVYGQSINPDKNGVTNTLPHEILNTVNYEYTGAGQTLVGSHSDGATILDKSPKPFVDKGISSGYNQQPTNTVTYNFRLHNRWDASDSLQHPFLADLMPPDVSIDPTSFSGISGPIGEPTVSVVNNFNGTGRQLVKFNWSVALEIGGDQYWSMDATIKAGASPGERTNLLMFMGADNPLINICDNYNYLRDTFDIDMDGRTLDDTLAAGQYATFNVIETTAIEALKLVKGECDTEFHKFPSVGKTIQGGTFQYRLSVTNVGNKPLTNIKIMDIMPWVGDAGVITNTTARDSRYDPVFVSMDTIASGVTVMYSDSQNPCRADLDPAITEASGCVSGTFSTTPSTDPQSLLFDFGSKIIQPGDSVLLYWTMRVPYGVAPGDVAWNSFGHRSESTTGTLVPPAEPIKVGVTVKSAQIGNFVWLDSNNDGRQDSGEPGVEGVLVHLLDSVMNPVLNPITMQPITTTTDVNGEYYFNVDPGKYFVKFDTPSNYGITSANNLPGDDELDSDVDNNGKSPMITVADGDMDHTWDAGLICISPEATFAQVAPTCTSGSPNDDGKITLTAVTNADKYGISTGASYSGPAYAGASSISGLPIDVQTAIPSAGETYTIRLFNGFDACYLDTTITVAPVNCVLPCSIVVTSVTPSACTPASNTYSLDIVVTYANAPSGNIDVTTSNGGSISVAQTGSPQTITLTGLVSDGVQNIDVTAVFAADNACTGTMVSAYDAPADCACPPVNCVPVTVVKN